jgi:hypothetical protein
MDFFWWKEKRFRAVWRVEKGGEYSFLVGTAHFCPYRFEKALTRLIRGAEIVAFEGPLDQETMDRVVQYGRQGENSPSLYEALDPRAVKEINRQLSARRSADTTTRAGLDIFQSATPDFVETHTRGVRPWLGFFTLWSALLDWNYSMDVEAFRIAQKLGKDIRFLETIEDQFVALDGIPFERIVNYLNHIGHWKAYKEMFLKAFLSGDLGKFVSMTGEFPTRCESILVTRDPIFFKGIKTLFEQGKTAAFVGAAHIPGIRERFLADGYHVTQVEA